MNSNQDHTLPWREGSPAAENSLLTDSFLPQAREHATDPPTAVHTDDSSCESLQQGDKHSVEEKQTEL